MRRTSRLTLLILARGWRPAAGWLCVLAAFTHLIIAPWLPVFWPACPPLPILDDNKQELLGWMFAIAAGLRTFEKYKGVTK